MSNYHFKDRRLSLKAKGLMSEMLSLPDDWDYSIAGLVAINKEEEGAIKSALKELKDAGYLEVVKKMPSKDNGGRIEYEYILHELPIGINKKQGGNFQGVEIQAVEVQGVENAGELNTNILNTNKQNTKELSIYSSDTPQKSSSRFTPPTVEEVSSYCYERGNNVNPERFIDYYTSNGWKVGKNKMKDWKAAVRTWERNEQPKSYRTPYNTGNEFEALYREEGYT